MRAGQKRKEGEKDYFNSGLSEHASDVNEVLRNFMYGQQKFQGSKNVARKAKRKK